MTTINAQLQRVLTTLKEINEVLGSPMLRVASNEAIKTLEDLLAKLKPATKKELDEAIARRENISYKSFVSGVEWSERRLGARKPYPARVNGERRRKDEP